MDEIVAKNGSFRESLQEGWLSADILNETLNNFTKDGAANYARSMVESGKWTQEQADAFRRKAFDEAQRWQGFLTLQPERIAVLAQRYAERMISYSFGSDGEITSLFQEEGFAVTSLSTVEVPGEMASTTYAELVAERV